MANKFERAEIAINLQIDKLRLEIAKLEQQKRDNKDLFFCEFPCKDAWIAKLPNGSFMLKDLPPYSGITVAPVIVPNNARYHWEVLWFDNLLFSLSTENDNEKTIIFLFRKALSHIEKAVTNSNNSYRSK